MEIKHILAILVVLMLSGCAAKAEEPEVVGGAEDVRVLRGGFDPEELTVSVGTVVTWKNMDNRAHIVNVIGKDASPRLDEGDIFEYKFEEEGTYRVMDAIFKFSGTITVE